MRCSLVLFFVIYGLKGSSQLNYPDILHYNFQLELNDLDDSIKAIATIDFLICENTGVINLDLGSVQDSSGRGMLVTELGLKTKNGSSHPSYSHQRDLLQIQTAVLNKGDSGTLIIQYKGIPSDGLIISKNKYGHRSFFADNWPDRGHQWIPCHDDPADKASLEFGILAPSHYQVIANGIQTEETNLEKNIKITRWKEEVPLSTKVMVIGLADFAVNLVGYVGCIPVYSWVYPEDRDKGFYDYALAKEILPFYIDHLGPYAYKKLANVESKTIFGGLENANTIFYSERSITGDRSNEGLLAHEIAHQWFGNMATEKSFAHLWLSEGFATYCNILYMEDKYGKETATEIIKKDRDRIISYSRKNTKAVVDTTTRDYMRLLNINTYEKGGWVLHMLRMQLGDSVFQTSVKKYYAQFAGSIADTRDLQKVFESVSGKNLNQFFNQWLFTPGQPGLSINWKYNPKAMKVEVLVTQTQKEVFAFPLDLLIRLESGHTQRQTIEVNKVSTSVSFKVTEKPIELVADPDIHLLFTSSITPSN